MKLVDLLEMVPTRLSSPLFADLSLITAMSPELAETELASHCAETLAAGYLTARPSAITAAVLTRNEGEHIDACLSALSGDADQYLLIDAESTDSTVDLARAGRSGVEVLTVPWIDDFAHHRNVALDHVSAGWVHFVDADEVMDPECTGLTRRALCVLDYLLPQADFVVSPVIVDTDGPGYSDNHRILRAGGPFAFKGRIHERPFDEAGHAPPRVHISVRFDHSGYTAAEFERKRKKERNGRLLTMCKEAEPDNPKWTYYLIRDTVDFPAASPDRLRELFGELESSLQAPMPAGAPEYWSERQADSWALLCDLALGFGGAEEIVEYAGRLEAVGRRVEAAYYTCLMESSRVLTRLSALADRIATVPPWETVDNRHLMGRLYEVQASVALASGRYELVGQAYRQALDRGAGYGVTEEFPQLRALLDQLEGVPADSSGQPS